MTEKNLLPCPFCGALPDTYTVAYNVCGEDRVYHAVQCMNDQCEVAPCTELHDTPEEAAAAWNRRTPGLRGSL